jgi:hypothetical protein
MSMKISLSSSILRLGFLLVLIGFFAPIACDSSGYQLAEGILGNAHQAGKAVFLGSIEHIYGYLLFGVFIFALVGLVLSFVSKAPHKALLETACLVLSFVLLTAVVLRIKSFRDSGLLHFVLTIIPVKIKPMVGAYSMAAGYLAGLVGVVLKFMRR